MDVNQQERGYWNMCEGCFCEEAYNLYKTENPNYENELSELF